MSEPEEVGGVHVSCTLITFFDLVFHMIVRSLNTKLKNDGNCWESLDIQIILHVSFKAMYFVLQPMLEFRVKLVSCGLV